MTKEAWRCEGTWVLMPYCGIKPAPNFSSVSLAVAYHNG